MLIGLDFDNTIVRYDGVFHAVAHEQGLIDANVAVSKLAVREALRAKGLEEAWIEMQGFVYGCRMDQAEAFDGVIDLLSWAKVSGYTCAIISHKTRHPYRGPAYDLHASAAEWIGTHLVGDDGPLVAPELVSFHETKDAKISQIAELGCDVFVDDLPEILFSPAFSSTTRRILFDPDGHHVAPLGVTKVGDWAALRTSLGG